MRKPVGLALLDAPIPALDGIRGLAILFVMAHHLAPVSSTDGPAYLWNGIMSGGWIGVDLFFVLSSFLITRGLLSTRGQARYFRDFFLKRVLRIFPLYFLFLAAYYLLVIQFEIIHFASEPVEKTARDLVPLWFFASNIWIAAQNGFLTNSINHFWTLAVEEQFYLLWPFVVFALSPKRLRPVCAALIVMSFLLRAYFVTQDGMLYALHVLTPFRLDTFAAGALIALTFHERHNPERIRHLALGTVLLTVTPLLGLWFWRQRLNAGDPLMQIFGYTLLAALFAALIAGAISLKPSHALARFFQARWLRGLGKYSFALYVFHHPLHIYFSERWSASALSESLGSPWLAMLAHAVPVATVSLGLAWLSHFFIESRFAKLRPLSERGGRPTAQKILASAS